MKKRVQYFLFTVYMRSMQYWCYFNRVGRIIGFFVRVDRVERVNIFLNFSLRLYTICFHYGFNNA